MNTKAEKEISKLIRQWVKKEAHLALKMEFYADDVEDLSKFLARKLKNGEK